MMATRRQAHVQVLGRREDRTDISRTDIQYVARYSLPDVWSIGADPTIVFDREANSNDRLTLPIGLGLTKTVRWEEMPIKLRIEAHYSLIQPESWDDTWNFRFQLTPVVKSPFSWCPARFSLQRTNS